MRIDDVNPSLHTPAAERAQGEPPTAGPERPTDDSGGDTARISSLARALGHHDTQRLEQLRLQVQNDGYHVSGEKVANAILNDANREIT